MDSLAGNKNGLADTYRGPRDRPVGFSAVMFGPSMYFDEDADTTIMYLAFERVCELALSPKKSQQLIDKIAREI